MTSAKNCGSHAAQSSHADKIALARLPTGLVALATMARLNPPWRPWWRWHPNSAPEAPAEAGETAPAAYSWWRHRVHGGWAASRDVCPPLFIGGRWASTLWTCRAARDDGVTSTLDAHHRLYPARLGPEEASGLCIGLGSSPRVTKQKRTEHLPLSRRSRWRTLQANTHRKLGQDLYYRQGVESADKKT